MEKTIIVGGGMAGMTCARMLQEHGIPYVLVSDNLGGRIRYLKEYDMNFGAVFYMQGYTHAREILAPGKVVLPSLLDLGCRKDLEHGYGVLSGKVLGAAPELVRFMRYTTGTFAPRYQAFNQACETKDMADAIAADPYIENLFATSADDLIEREHFARAADAIVSQFVHACTGASIHTLNALDYLNCAMGIVDTAQRFSFDPEDMCEYLSQRQGDVLLEKATSVKRDGNAWCVETDAGTKLKADNLVMAAPANVARELLESVTGPYEIRNASELHAYKVRGRIKETYTHQSLHLFDESIPLINIGKRDDGAYEVFTCKPLDMGIFFDEYEVEHTEDWPYALFTSPSIVLRQDLGDGLYRIGDHNMLGLEPAAISGVFAANKIIDSFNASEGIMKDRLLDKEGNPVEGLPLTYGNIDEAGNVLYLDEERFARKANPERPVYVNHSAGIGVKNFFVSHLSARDWNWNVILAVFRKIVAWSASMREPESLKSKVYKRAMFFEPQDLQHTSASVYNLAVDSERVLPGTSAYLEAKRKAAEGDEEAQKIVDEADSADTLSARLNQAIKRAHEEGADEHHEEHCDVLAAVHDETAKGTTIVLNKTVYENASKVTVPMDLVKKAIMEAHYIGGMKECLCRAGQNCQNYPHDLACLFLNQGGKVVVKHGMAVELTKDEALARVDRAAELGLTCQSLWVEIEQFIWGFTNDQMDAFMEICFCCPCCCVGMNLSKNATRDVKRRFSPSGWTAVVDTSACVGCKECVGDYCPQDAIHFRESDGVMVVDQENCIGCGICRSRCKHGAIAIRQTMPMRESMRDYYLKEGRLDIVAGPDFEGVPENYINTVLETATMGVGSIASNAASPAGIDGAAEHAEVATALLEDVHDDTEGKHRE